jgi:hypothetical protein
MSEKEEEETIKVFVAAPLDDIREVVREELERIVPAWVKVAESVLDPQRSLSGDGKSDVKLNDSDSEERPHISQPSDGGSVTQTKNGDIETPATGSESEAESPESGAEAPTAIVKRAMNHVIMVGRYHGKTIQEIHDEGDNGLRYLKLLATSSLKRHREAVHIVLDHYGVPY